MKKVFDAIEELTRQSVYVGFPDSGASRKDSTEPTNATIAFIQEHGSPKANIPARPFMIPGITSIKSVIINDMRRAAVAALQGEQQAATQILNQLGLKAQSAIQRAITRGEGWPPLAPMTLALRKAKGFKGTHPLIASGQLRQHVTYVIRRRAKQSITAKIMSLLQT